MFPEPHSGETLVRQVGMAIVAPATRLLGDFLRVTVGLSPTATHMTPLRGLHPL